MWGVWECWKQPFAWTDMLNHSIPGFAHSNGMSKNRKQASDENLFHIYWWITLCKLRPVKFWKFWKPMEILDAPAVMEDEHEIIPYPHGVAGCGEIQFWEICPHAPWKLLEATVQYHAGCGFDSGVGWGRELSDAISSLMILRGRRRHDIESWWHLIANTISSVKIFNRLHSGCLPRKVFVH